MIAKIDELLEPIELIAPVGELWLETAPPADFCNTGVIATCSKGWYK